MGRKMQMVANQVNMKIHNQSVEDMEYWLSKPVAERLACVTFLVNQNLKVGERMKKEKTGQIHFK